MLVLNPDCSLNGLVWPIRTVVKTTNYIKLSCITKAIFGSFVESPRQKNTSRHRSYSFGIFIH